MSWGGGGGYHRGGSLGGTEGIAGGGELYVPQRGGCRAQSEEERVEGAWGCTSEEVLHIIKNGGN